MDFPDKSSPTCTFWDGTHLLLTEKRYRRAWAGAAKPYFATNWQFVPWTRPIRISENGKPRFSEWRNGPWPTREGHAVLSLSLRGREVDFSPTMPRDMAHGNVSMREWERPNTRKISCAQGPFPRSLELTATRQRSSVSGVDVVISHRIFAISPSRSSTIQMQKGERAGWKHGWQMAWQSRKSLMRRIGRPSICDRKAKRLRKGTTKGPNFSNDSLKSRPTNELPRCLKAAE